MPQDHDPFTGVHVSQTEYRIYNRVGDVYAVVDYEDYVVLSQYQWNATSKCVRNRRKVYMRRTLYVRGTRNRAERYRGKSKTRLLHVEIMERTGKKPPTPEHIIVDHRDGEGLNCRRKNLRWATRKQNNINRNGSHPEDFQDDEEPEKDAGKSRRRGPARGGDGLSEVQSGDTTDVGPIPDCPF